MAQLSVPVEVQAYFKDNPSLMAQFVKEVAKGTKEARDLFLKITNQKYDIDMVWRVNNAGEATSVLRKTNKFIDDAEKAWKKETKAQEGSISKLTKRLSKLKQEQNAVKRIDLATGKLTKSWLSYQQKIDATTRSINKQKGGFDALVAKTGKLGAGVAGVAKFIPVVGKVMFAVQGLQQAFDMVNQVVGAFVARQKQIEGMEMALKGFGASTGEVEKVMSGAASISMKYGQSLTAIEKGFKRITPTILAMGGTVGDTEAIMSAMSARMATLGLNSEQSGRYMEAFAQVMGKGKLQAEELNQQFSELDGALRPAVAEFLKANYGITDLDSAMRKGEVTAGMFAEAMVEGSKEMQAELGEAVLGVQNKLDSFNINQLQNVFDTLNTFSLEAIGSQFESTGAAFMSLKATWTQFVASITTNSQEIGSLVSTVFAVVGRAINTIIDLILIFIKSVVSIVEVVLRVTKAIGQWAMSFKPVADEVNKLIEGAQEFGKWWGWVKDTILNVDKNLRDVEETMGNGVTKGKEYTATLGDMSAGADGLTQSTQRITPEIAAMIQKLVEEGEAANIASEGLKDLIEKQAQLIMQNTEVIQSAAGILNSVEGTSARLASLSESYDKAGMSTNQYLSEVKAAESTYSSQITALQGVITKLEEKKAAGDTLTDAERANLAESRQLIDSYRQGQLALQESAQKAKDYGAALDNVSVAARNKMGAVDALVLSVQNEANAMGAFSSRQKDVAVAARDAADSLGAERTKLQELATELSNAAGGIDFMTTSQQKEYTQLQSTIGALSTKINKYEELAVASQQVISYSGQLSTGFANAYGEVMALGKGTGLSADQMQDFFTQAKGVSSLLSGSLNAAQKEYNGLLAQQISQNGRLSQSEEARLNSLRGIIGQLSSQKQELDQVVSAQQAVANATADTKTEAEKYAEALENQGEKMRFSITQAKNLVQALQGAGGLLSSLSRDTETSGLTISEMTSAIDSQISSLEGYSAALVQAQLAGQQLTAAEQEQLETARALVEKLREKKTALEASTAAQKEAAQAARENTSATNAGNKAGSEGTRVTNSYTRAWSEAEKQAYANKKAINQWRNEMGELSKTMRSLIAQAGGMKELGAAVEAAAQNYKNLALANGQLDSKTIAAKQKLDALSGTLQTYVSDAVTAAYTETGNFNSALTENGMKLAAVAEDLGAVDARTQALVSAVDSATSSTGNQNSALGAQAQNLNSSTEATGSLSTAQQSLQSNVINATAALEAQQTALNNVKEAMSALENNTASVTTATSRAMDALNAASNENTASQSRLEAAQERVNNARSALISIENEISALEGKGITVSSELLQARQRAATLAMNAANELVAAKQAVAKEEAVAAQAAEAAATRTQAASTATTQTVISNSRTAYNSQVSMSQSLSQIEAKESTIRETIAAARANHQKLVSSGASQHEIDNAQRVVDTQYRLMQRIVQDKETATNAINRSTSSQESFSASSRGRDLKSAQEHGELVLEYEQKVAAQSMRIAKVKSDYEEALRNGATEDELNKIQQKLAAEEQIGEALGRELASAIEMRREAAQAAQEIEEERISNTDKMRDAETERVLERRQEEIRAAEAAAREQEAIQSKEGSGGFTGIRTVTSPDAEDTAEAVERTAVATKELTGFQEVYTDQLSQATKMMKGLTGTIETEIADGMKTTTKYTTYWGQGIQQAKNQLAKSVALMTNGVAVQEMGLDLAWKSGEISKKKYAAEIAHLQGVTEAIQIRGQRAIAEAQVELRGIARQTAARQAAFASEMLARESRLAFIREEAELESMVISRIGEATAAAGRARDTEIQAAERIRDMKTRSIDSVQAKEKIAFDQRMSKLDYELEKTRQIADTRIKELERLTPAEMKLAALREQDLKKRANDGSLSARERLEAKAQLERLERNKQIAKEREKVEKIEEQMNALQNERTLSEKKAAAAKAGAEAAYQKSVLRFQDLYFERTKELFAFEIAAKRRLAGIEQGLISEVLEGEQGRSNLNNFMANANKEAKSIMDGLNSTLDGLSQSVASAIGGAGEQMEALAKSTGDEKLGQIATTQEAMARFALKEAERRNSETLSNGELRLSISKSVREYEIETAKTLMSMYSSIGVGSSSSNGKVGSSISGGVKAVPLMAARASGGPVSGGSLYQVNELGREGFLSASGSLKEINAPAFGSWKAPSSGTVIPADVWSELKASRPTHAAPGASFSGSGTQTSQASLLAALSGLSAGSKDTITNNVTIQSDSPVQAASDMLVQMTKIRRRRMR